MFDIRGKVHLRELTGKKTAMEYLETVLTYVSRGTDRIDEEDFRCAVEEAFPQVGGDIMPTLAEKWIEQGMQQGMQQGILQKSREAVIDILEVRFKVVPQSIVKALK